MIHLKRLLSKFGDLFHSTRVEEELEREITAHLTLLEDDFLRKGMSTEEARWAARRAYGGVERAKQLHRDERSIVWIERLRQDVRYALRQLAKSPGFSVVAVVTFALGIGANTAIFSLADLIIRRPVSLPGLDRLASIEEQNSTSADKGISAANYFDLLGTNHTFEQLAAYEYWSAGVGGQGRGPFRYGGRESRGRLRHRIAKSCEVRGEVAAGERPLDPRHCARARRGTDDRTQTARTGICRRR